MSSTTNNTLKVFIGSIPQKITSQDLEEYFKNFPGVTKIKMNKKPGCQQNNTAIIRFDNEESYNLALKEKTITLKQESLNVQHYFKGQKLVDVEEDISKRRIYVDRIPFDTTDQELREFFSEFGTVETGYVCSYRRRDNADNDYGFITMKDAREAQNLLEMKNVEKGNLVLELKPFKFKGKIKVRDSKEASVEENKNSADLNLLNTKVDSKKSDGRRKKRRKKRRIAYQKMGKSGIPKGKIKGKEPGGSME